MSIFGCPFPFTLLACQCILLHAVTIANSLDPDRPDEASGLFWVQAFGHSGGIPKNVYEKVF